VVLPPPPPSNFFSFFPPAGPSLSMKATEVMGAGFLSSPSRLLFPPLFSSSCKGAGSIEWREASRFLLFSLLGFSFIGRQDQTFTAAVDSALYLPPPPPPTDDLVAHMLSTPKSKTDRRDWSALYPIFQVSFLFFPPFHPRRTSRNTVRCITAVDDCVRACGSGFSPSPSSFPLLAHSAGRGTRNIAASLWFPSSS